MGRPERQLDPGGGPLQRFALELRALRAAAGRPSYRELAGRAHYSVTALSEAAGGEVLPSLPVTLAYAAACGGDADEWEARWRRVAAELADDQAPPGAPADEAPYPGLSTFEPGDADRFFGRDGLVAELCTRISQSSFLAVFGPSGAGKSSLLRAGLLPALWNGALPGSESWPTTLLTPGERPVEELALHLAELKNTAVERLQRHLTDDPASIRRVLSGVLGDGAGTDRVVLVVDQFEEVFTHCRDAAERARFLDILLAAAEEPSACVVLGARADFYARCAEYPDLVTALRDRQLLIGPMDDADLRQAITGPARRAGCPVETALVEAVVTDARDQAGALPLVSHALLETWRQRRSGTLTLATYRAAGGVQGAIAQTAERVYAGFAPPEQELAREVFLRLTAFGDGTEDTRRHASRAELLGGPDGPAVAGVLATLTAARLVTVDAEHVTVAHEALIRSWPRLRSWLAEDRELLRAHRRLTEAAAEWDRGDRDEAFLYRGARLSLWDGRALGGLDHLEREFLAAGRARELRERTAVRRRVRLVLGGLVAALAAISTLAAVALVQARNAQAQRDMALSRQLTAEARNQLDLDPELGLLLARRAYAARATPDSSAVLRQAVVDSHLRAVLPVDHGRALGLAFSRDGRWLASTAGDGTVRVWTWAGHGVRGAPKVFRGHRGETWAPTFAPDGTRLATAGADGTARVWDPTGHAAPLVLADHRGPVRAVTFSPDGRRLASAGDDGTVSVRALTGGAPPTVLRGHHGPVWTVAFSPDGRRVATGGADHSVRVWDLRTGRARLLAGHDDIVKSVVFSPDGRTLASGSIDGTARVWPTAGGGSPVVLRGHTGTVESVAFAPSGRWLVTSGDDATARVWSATGNGDPLVLRGHTGTVWQVAFTPDGRQVASASEDGTVRLWDPAFAGDPTPLGGRSAAWTAVFSPDGRRVISGGADRTVRVQDAGGAAAPVVLRGHTSEVLGLAVSPDGERVASASRDGTIRVWDLTGAHPPRVLRGHHGPVWVAAWSPDGRRLASAGKDGTLRIWPLDGTGAPLVRRADPVQIRYVSYGPDGRRVATAGWDGVVRIWDTTGTAPPRLLRGHDGFVWGVAMSPDNRHVASGGSDGTVRIWDLTGAEPPRVLRGHHGFVWSVTYSRDGRWVASTGADGTLRLWRDVAGGESVTFGGFGASVETADFTPDGRRIVTAHDDGSVRVWDCEVCGPMTEVEAVAARRSLRDLTPDERRAHLGTP